MIGLWTTTILQQYLKIVIFVTPSLFGNGRERGKGYSIVVALLLL